MNLGNRESGIGSRGLLIAAALLVLFAGTAQAQRFEGSAGIERLSTTLRDTASGRQSGVFFAAAGSLGLGPVRLGVRGNFGTVSDPARVLPDRRLRVTTVALSFRPSPALELGAEAHARREEADTNVVLHRLGGVFGRFTTGFGLPGLEGIAELAYLPLSSATNAQPVTVALRAAVGARFSPNGGPVSVELGYRFFRIDHEASPAGVARLEQDEGLLLAIGFRSRTP